MEKQIFVFTDGGARGNPGPAAIGFIVKDFQGKVMIKVGKCIGRATNNVAEYTAVIEALKYIKKLSAGQLVSWTAITFFLDSQLAVNQLNGLYKVKDFGLRNLVIKVRQLEKEIGGNVVYQHISREKNKEADTLVNQSFNTSIKK